MLAFRLTSSKNTLKRALRLQESKLTRRPESKNPSKGQAQFLVPFTASRLWVNYMQKRKRRRTHLLGFQSALL